MGDLAIWPGGKPLALPRTTTRRLSARERVGRYPHYQPSKRATLHADARPINRKVSLNVWRYAAARVCSPEECCRKDIETATQHVDVSAGLDVECEREQLFLESHYHVVCGWRWLFFDRYVEIACEPGFNPFLEGWELGYGPVNACLSV